jgi:hypothetical protein
LLLALLVPVSAQRTEDSISAPLHRTPYQVGERLTYNVSFSNIISAAHVELRVVARGTFFGRDALQLRGSVRTTGLVNVALFALNNEYITYVDPETGLPFRTQQIIRETTRSSDLTNEFEPASGTFDFLSALYRLRALPLREGSAHAFTVRGENREYQVEFKVSGRRTIKTSVGSFNSLVTRVRVRNDHGLDNIRIYFSDDERHLPVLITLKHAAGEIRAELAGSDMIAPRSEKSPPTAGPVTQPINPPPNSGGPPSGNSGELENLPFKIGEQLTYQVYLGTVAQPAATASFHVRGRSRYFEHDGLLLTASAQTTNAIQRLFFANDRINTYVDPKTLLPYRTEMNLIEGRRRLDQILTLNQNYGTASTDKGERIEIPVGTHDFISFFYALRTFNLTPPKRNAISLLVNNQTKTLFISALKRETIRLGERDIPAIQLSLTTDDPQGDRYQLRAWVSADARRLPLRLTAQTEIGQVRADLAIIPLTSQ